MSSLALKKYAFAFAIGFLPPFLLGLTTLFEKIQEAASNGTVDPGGWAWVLFSLVSGAVATAIRTVMIAANMMPGDQLVGPNKTEEAVTVTPQS